MPRPRPAALVIAATLLLGVAGPAPGRPTAQEEADALPAHINALVGGDPAGRAAAREWLLNELPSTLPHLERVYESAKAAAAAGGPKAGVAKDAADQLGPILGVVRRLSAIRLARATERWKARDWQRKAALAGYDEFGWHNPAWDAAAREAIGQYYSADPAERAKAGESLAHAAGPLHCTDPLVLLLHGNKLSDKGSAKPWPIRSFNAWTAARFIVTQGGYPAHIKAEALGRNAKFIHDYRMAEGHPNLVGESKADAAALLKLWPEVLAEPGLPFADAYSIGGWVLDAQAQHAGADRGALLYSTVLPSLARAYPGEPGVKAFEGAQLVAWGWDARGSDVASTVTPEGWRLLRERLDRAEAVLTAAWRADPERVAYPLVMLGVGQGNDYPEAKMNLWFARAVRAFPDADRLTYGNMWNPYEARAITLEPKWGGSRERMLAFGRECVESRNWAGGVPWVLLDLHQQMADESPDADAYWHRADVWPDLDALTAGSLRVWPDDARLRTIRARWAWKCGQWKVADAAFEALGDRAVPGVFGGLDNLAAARAEAKAKAAAE